GPFISIYPYLCLSHSAYFFVLYLCFCFFFNHPSTPYIYTLSLHDALRSSRARRCVEFDNGDMYVDGHKAASDVRDEFVSVTEKRSEERFSRNAETDIVCRLLLEKKKQQENISSGDVDATYSATSNTSWIP